jgi:glycosyltransferase involved in cell wall biosynthesis
MCPRVSVIIPTYNRAATLARCLESLVAQTMQKFEVLVCDDGSTDETAKIVAAFSDRLDLTYENAENFGGPARPRNRGLRAAKAPFVAFLDSDDWWLPRKLELSLHLLEDGADLVYHPLLLATSEHQRYFLRKTRTYQLRSPVFDDLLRRGNAVINSSVVMRRELLTGLGGFAEDKRLIAVEDFDAWLRVARATEKFVHLPQALGYYWSGGGNISSADRTLQTTCALEERYCVDLARLVGSATWIPYVKSQALLQLGRPEAARAELAAARSGGPLSLRIRLAVLSLRVGSILLARRTGRSIRGLAK